MENHIPQGEGRRPRDRGRRLVRPLQSPAGRRHLATPTATGAAEPLAGHLAVRVLAHYAPATGEESDEAATFRHLLEVCPVCRRAYQRLLHADRALLHWDVATVLPEAEAAPGLWATLEALPYPRQLQLVRAEPRFHTWGFALHCVRRSAALVSAAPEEARRAANLALAVTDELDPSYDEDWICDLAALAYANLADACREMRELVAAGEAIDSALRRWEDGTEGCAVEAEILFRQALLRRDQGRLAEAVDLLARVHAIRSQPHPAEEGTHDPHAAGVALLHRAWCQHHLGCHAEALATLGRASALLDPGRDADLALALHTGRAWCLLRLGQADEAAVAASLATELARSLGDRGAEVRLRLARLRIPSEDLPAEETLRAAVQGFFEAGLEIDAALALLDLADHLLEAEAACDQIAPLAADMFPAFTSVEVGREEMAALLLFQEACREGRLTRELAQQLASLLERLRRPSLAWWSGRGTVLREERRR